MRRWLPSPTVSPAAAAVALGLLGLLTTASVAWIAAGGAALPLDDSWIHLELARHLAAGDGLSYEAGAPVTASTAPLWTALIALGPSAASPILWSVLGGAALWLLSLPGIGALGARLGLEPASRIGAPLLVATSPWMLWAALSGMELSLAIALSVWGLAFHHGSVADGRSGDRRGLLLLCLAPLARPEALLLLAFAVIDRARRFGARILPADLLLALLAVGPVAGAYTVIGGSPLPTTLGAKAAGGPSLEAAARFFRAAADVFLRSLPIPLLFLAPALLAPGRRSVSAGRAAFLWIPGLLAAYAVLTPGNGPVLVGNFGRYLFPLFPLVALFGLHGLVRTLGPSRRRRLPAFVLVAALQAALWSSGPSLYRHSVLDVEATDVAAARWLRDHAPPDLVVAAQDVGAIGYLAPQAVLGLVGIVDPEVREVLDRQDLYWERALLEYLDRRRPDLMVVFRRSYPMISRPSDGFRVLARFERAENRTMAGSELLVLQTPWSRWRPAGG